LAWCFSTLVPVGEQNLGLPDHLGPFVGVSAHLLGDIVGVLVPNDLVVRIGTFRGEGQSYRDGVLS